MTERLYSVAFSAEAEVGYVRPDGGITYRHQPVTVRLCETRERGWIVTDVDVQVIPPAQGNQVENI